jgi:ribose/xylose/arabinose/galactoside ABC-type transport system permease subunit
MGAQDAMIAPVLLLVALFGALVGGVNGTLSTKLGIPSFIVTLAMLLILQSINLVWTSGAPASDLAPAFAVFATMRFVGVPVGAVLLVLIVILAWFMLSRTVLGRRFLAVGSNPDAARVAGVDVGRARLWAFILSGLCAAAAGAFYTSYVGSGQSWLGSGMELTAIAAAVIGGVDLFGGRGTAVGAVGGALLLAVIFNLLIIAGVPAAYNPVVTGLLLLAGIGLNLAADRHGRFSLWFASRGRGQ